MAIGKQLFGLCTSSTFMYRGFLVHKIHRGEKWVYSVIFVIASD